MVCCCNDTATTEIYTRSLHDERPICDLDAARQAAASMTDDELLFTVGRLANLGNGSGHGGVFPTDQPDLPAWPLRLYALARKSTRLNSRHAHISYSVFCFKKNTFSIP